MYYGSAYGATVNARDTVLTAVWRRSFDHIATERRSQKGSWLRGSLQQQIGDSLTSSVWRRSVPAGELME